MSPEHKPLLWLYGEIKTPPFSDDARLEAGYLLRMLQMGERLSMPESRPMPSIGPGCHELRIKDKEVEWRIIYRIDPDAVVLMEIFNKKTRKTPKKIIETCKARLQRYDSA